jgi:alkylation response protein AidB-like acyl-CoA dehydrogenase
MPFVPAAHHVEESAALRALRAEVRAFIREEIASGGFVPAVDCWLNSWDEAFSRRLAARGWLGMTIPVEYGGHGRSFLERFVVTEELLAAGAPLAAHWISDRQIGPSLMKFGSEEQRRKLLPGIAKGEVFFAIGMSEPDSGSDLASVRTKAVKAGGGWQLTGSKIWTSGAHRSHWFIVLARSAPLDPEHRHAGLSQFIVALDSPGIDIRPIVSMNGHHHFNQVFFDNVFVPDAMLFGREGDGWKQVTSELSYERSGPERFLSTLGVLSEMASATQRGDLAPDPELGRMFARLMALHRMSLSVADALTSGHPTDQEAAIVKVLGTATEGDVAELASLSLGSGQADDGIGRLREMTATALLSRPGFTLRGGTNEILRGVIARGLGLR